MVFQTTTNHENMQEMLAAFRLVRWLFRAIDGVPFRIPHFIFSGPESLEFFCELKSLFRILARCNVHEFAVLKLPQHAIHGTRPSFLLADLPMGFLRCGIEFKFLPTFRVQACRAQ